MGRVDEASLVEVRRDGGMRQRVRVLGCACWV